MLPFRVTDKKPFSVDTTSLFDMKQAFAKPLAAAGWMPVPAADIPAFGAFETENAATAAQADEVTGSNWDRLQHYQAFTYFHPTVRNFLFGSVTNGEPTNDYLQVFRRNDVAQICVAVDVYNEGKRCEQVCTFDVVRCDLALMQPDVGVLQLELRARIREGEAWSLKVVQQVRDRMRRLYPPYFDEGRGGHFPNRVWICGVDAKAAPLYDGAVDAKTGRLPQRFVDATLSVLAGGIPKDAETSPCAGHWEYLLAPLVNNAANLRLILPGDDRLPSMAFVAMDNPRAISRGDWVRLTYANEAGSDVLPYSRKFLRDFEKRHCYDRFWHKPGDADESPSRIMNCGYAFTMVGSFANQGFFMNQRNGALVAFRQIYARMGLVAHFQKTALLGATARLSSLSWRDSKGGKLRRYDEREQQIMSVYQHFIEFTHVFWFDEVSPQEQGVEMFAMWQRSLRSKELYDEVRQELKDLVEYVGAERAKAQAVAADKFAQDVAKLGAIQADTAHRFTRTAAALGVLGVFAGLLGMNILPIENGLWHGSTPWFFSWWSLVWTVLAVALTLALTACVGLCAYRRKPEWLANWLGQMANKVPAGAKSE